MEIKKQAGNFAKRSFLFVLAILLLGGMGIWFIMANSKIERVGELDGISEKYYWMGKLLGERHYQGGKLHGMTKTFYGDGQIKAEWEFKAGKMDGTARHYNRDGNVSSEEIYSDGKKMKRINYNSKGKVISEEVYKK